jgi:hypothetical protein
MSCLGLGRAPPQSGFYISSAIPDVRPGASFSRGLDLTPRSQEPIYLSRFLFCGFCGVFGGSCPLLRLFAHIGVPLGEDFVDCGGQGPIHGKKPTPYDPAGSAGRPVNVLNY